MNHGCVSLSRRSSVKSRKLVPFMVNQEAETAVKDCDWCPPRDGPCGGPLRRVTSEGQAQKADTPHLHSTFNLLELLLLDGQSL